MMKRAAIGVMAMILSAATLAAQAKPDFSGTWVINPEKSAAANGRTGGGASMAAAGGGSTMSASGGNSMSAVGAGGRGAAPMELAIVQTATALTIDRSGPVPQKFVHKLDGTESTNVNGRATMKTKSHWQGATLVTEGTNVIAGEDGTISVTLKEVRSLDKEGNLVIAATRTIDGNTNTTTQVFSKKK